MLWETRRTRGERNTGRQKKSEKGEGEGGGESSEGFLAVRRRGRYTAKCRGGFISLSVLFIDVLSASLVPTVARALSFLLWLPVYTYIYVAAISCVSLSLFHLLLLSFYRASYRVGENREARCTGTRALRDRSRTDPDRETIVCVAAQRM